MQLNVRNTNIIIFNQRKQQSNLEFKFGSESIKIVDTYQYLGIKVHKNGDFKCAVGTLKQKGHKAMFSLSQSLYTGITFNPDLPLKIFDHTIRPILTYGSEVWCFQYINALFKTKVIDKLPFEQTNNRFCKYVMGLPRQATNLGIKAELGRKPILAFICSQALRYWIRLINLEESRLLKLAYMSELSIFEQGRLSWVTFIIKLLEIIQKKHLWDKHVAGINCSVNDMTSLKESTQKIIADMYFTNEFQSINEKCKLRTYKKMKHEYNMESYVNICNVPLSWRKLNCSFRISCHELEVERGRYTRPYKPP